MYRRVDIPSLSYLSISNIFLEVRKYFDRRSYFFGGGCYKRTLKKFEEQKRNGQIRKKSFRAVGFDTT